MYVLGLSFDYHDSGVALVKDGKLCSAVEEERFNRQKHSFDFPKLSIDYALAEQGITINDVDYVGFYEKPLVKFERILKSVLTTWPCSYLTWLKALPLWLKRKMRVGRNIQKELGVDKDIVFCEHHLSHAASAFLVSPYEEAAIITADGVGEWTTTAFGIGRGTQIDMAQRINFPHSIGLFFSALTAYLGFKVNDAEWKVMGLAPYGKPKYVDKFRQIIDIKEDGSFRLNLKYFAHHYSDRRMFTKAWERLLGQPKRPRETELGDFHADVAHSGQKIVEEVMFKIARHAYATYKVPNLCIAGGVGLNCVANWKIHQNTPFKNIYIQPAAGDSGGALGTAFHIYNTLLGKPREFVMSHGYWGPEFTQEQVVAVLQANNAKFTVVDDDALLTETAKMLDAGKVIGWFQGRMEFGPRALGNRSILADPRNPEMKEIINAKVKFREKFRPFAPAVLKEAAHEWFDMPAGMDLPFMLMVPDVRSECRTRLPAVTHQDGTGRVQTLTEQDNGRFYKLVKRFGELTGVPILVNTSFNVRGEPIVCNPQDAYNTFVNTGIDALVIGNCILTHKPGAVDYDAGMKRSVALESAPSAAVTTR